MKNKKRFVALGLAVGMVLSMAACGNNADSDKTEVKESSKQENSKQEENASGESVTNELSWLNLDSELPIVKEGEEPKKLTIMTQVRDMNMIEKCDNSWTSKYLEHIMNIDIEWVAFTSENATETINITMNGDVEDMPDIIIYGLRNSLTLAEYGVEGKVIDIAPYINETYMPNLYNFFETQDPIYRATHTTPDGHIWSLGYIAAIDSAERVRRPYINMKWLDECGLEVPTTFEEFKNVMKTFKENGYAEYPIGGSNATDNISVYLQAALGYADHWGNGVNPVLRNDGKVVVPGYDEERWPTYLKWMHELYTEGLLHPDYFTMDSNTTYANTDAGTGFCANLPSLFVSNAEKHSDYWATTPLTSEWVDADDARWDTWFGVYPMDFAITGHCEYPELAARFADYFYKFNAEDPELTLGGFQLFNTGFDSKLIVDAGMAEDIAMGDPKYEIVQACTVDSTVTNPNTYYYKYWWDHQDEYPKVGNFKKTEIFIWPGQCFGIDAVTFAPLGSAVSTDPSADAVYSKLTDNSDKDPLENWKTFLPDYEKIGGNNWFLASLQVQVKPYVRMDIYPPFRYESTDVVDDVMAAYESYVVQESAKFITGERELNDAELEDYFKTMKGFGIDDMISWLQDYYDRSAAIYTMLE